MHLANLLSIEPNGEELQQLAELTLALVLSTLIGLEREFKTKSAGLRTHTLVGVAAALIMLVSKYGFSDILATNRVVLDPSRVAAQVVSGIGFIGGGLIFVQRDVVRGLTTAAIIWLTAAVGMACGAGLPVLAVFVTAAHFLVIFGYAALAHRYLEHPASLSVQYVPGKGAVEKVVQLCLGRGYRVQGLVILPTETSGGDERRAIQLQLLGRGGLEPLIVALSDVKGVLSTRLVDAAEAGAHRS